MSEAVVLPAGTPAPGAPVVPAAPPVAAPVVAAPPVAPAAPAEDPNNPPWLAGRLEEARERALRDLGITDAKKAKEMLDAARAAEDEKKSLAERFAETTKSLSKAQTEAEKLREVTKEWATRQMMALTPEQQAAVKALAGDDFAQQLKAITALQPTWSAQTQAAAPAAPKPATPASGTAPSHTAPDGTQLSQPDHKAVHAALLKHNPFAAAQYAQEHVRDVFPDAQ